MSLPVGSPMYNAAYPSPQVPPMAAGSPYTVSPFTPAIQQTPAYYPQMGAMQMNPQPVIVQQPYPMYSRSCCDGCCDGCCQCCAGL